MSVPSSIYEVVAVGMWVVHLEGAILTPSSLNRSLGHRLGTNAKRAGDRRGREKERRGRGGGEGCDMCLHLCNRRKGRGLGEMVL